MQNRKRILSVTIKRMVDEIPDTSSLGKYSNKPESEYAIDRAHSEDCASVMPVNKEYKQMLVNARGYIAELQSTAPYIYNEENQEWDSLEDAYNILDYRVEGLQDCDCGERGDMRRNEYRYFNGPIEHYKGESPEDIRKYVRQDYERMESFNAGNWYYIGIRAEAEIATDSTDKPSPMSNKIIQTITSGGLWGIESDSDKSYLKEIEQEELSNLKSELRALGFSTRTISQAFKSINKVSE